MSKNNRAHDVQHACHNSLREYVPYVFLIAFTLT